MKYAFWKWLLNIIIALGLAGLNYFVFGDSLTVAIIFFFGWAILFCLRDLMKEQK